MITDDDIAQALHSQKAKPSKEWHNATLRRLRAISSKNHVTETVGKRTSHRGTAASLASTSFPTNIMNPVFLKIIGSLAAVCMITVGTHAVANSATPENSFLYAIDRGLERVELAFAKIGGKASVAHKHLIHAEERSTEIDVLLRGEASASLSFKDLLVETAYAQSLGANATISAHVQLLVDDCRDSLNTAVAILEEIADSASAKTKAELAVAIEMTSQHVSQRLEASAQATAEVDVRPVIRQAIATAKETERKARSMQVRIDAEADADVEARSEEHEAPEGSAIEGSTTIESNTKVDARSGIEAETDASVDANVEVDLPAVEIESDGGVELNLGTQRKQRGGGGRATTNTEAQTEGAMQAPRAENTESDTSDDADNTENVSGDSEQKASGSTNTEVHTEVNVELEGSINTETESGVETDISTEAQSDTSLDIGN